MNERLAVFWDAVKAWWERLSRIGRTLFIVAGGVIIIGIILLIVFYQSDEPEYGLLYDDLNMADRTRALAILNESQITSRVMPNGDIMVLLDDVDEARMLLAAGGFQADKFSHTTYEPGLTATQADKDRYERWDLQDRIQNQIEATYTDVSQAVVTLAVSPKNSFAFQEDELPPSASVALVMQPNKTLSSGQIQGLLDTVMFSVPGLTEENISIIDQTGDIRARLESNIDASSDKLRLKGDFDEINRRKILEVLEPMFGPGNVEVQVNTLLDTDERIAETINYHPFDPDDPTNNAADYIEWYNNFNGPEDAVVAGVPGANDNIQTPQYGQDQGDVAGLDSYENHNIIDYLVGSTKEQIKKSGFGILDLTAAVTINAETLRDGLQEEVIALSANAIGAMPEKVSVVNMAFYTPPEVATGGEPEAIATWMIIVGIILLIIIIALIIIAFLLANKKKKDEEEAEFEDEEEVLYDEDGMPITDVLDGEEDFEPITIIETQEQKLKGQIKDLADSDPEIVANLLKTWLQ